MWWGRRRQCATKPTEQPMPVPPAPTKPFIVLINRIAVSHGPVAGAANGTQVVHGGATTLGLGLVVAGFERERSDLRAAPHHCALAYVFWTYMAQPYFVLERSGNGNLRGRHLSVKRP